MNPNWVKADAWYRRDTDEGGYLTVCRSRAGTWSWCWHISRTGGELGRESGHETHLSAMIAADHASAKLCEVLA